MSNNIYALLVGIDKYPEPVNPLQGCVNDIERIETLLSQRIEQPKKRFKVRTLTDEGATRQAIIDGFEKHLSKAGKDDVALFYYSGHGSQSKSPQEFWHLEPDRLDETLVCWDSRLPEGDHWDLADKELALLIEKVAAKGAHVAIILDCCHSGSGTRGDADPEVRVRRVPTDARDRPINTFLVTPEQATALSGSGRSVEGGGWYTLPKGRHVVLAACNPEEEAKELSLGGEQRGAFSYYLQDTLQRAGESLSYRDLFKRVNALVRARVSAQSPQMEATETPDLDQPFLGGAIPARQPYYTVSLDNQRGWVIDGGAVHGIPAPKDGETTLLALFPFDADIEKLKDLSGALGEARIEQVFPTQSAVKVTRLDGNPLDTDTYKAIVTSFPLPPLVVAFSGEESGLALVRAALATAGPEDKPSLLVREGEREDAELLLEAVENRYRIRRKGDGYGLGVDTPGFNQGSAQLVVQRLEHIARWMKIVELTNDASRIPTSAVQMEILQLDQQDQWQPVVAGSNIRLDYTFKAGKWVQPQFKIKLSNRSQQRLYYMLLGLPESYGVFPVLTGGGVWLEPDQETWANDGKPIFAVVRDEYWKQGVVEFKDTLKLIVSTDEGDATLLGQEDLPVTVTRSISKGTRSLTRASTLNRLMNRVQTRHFSSEPADSEIFVDWSTAEVSFTTVRPLLAADIATPSKNVPLGQGVSVQGHPSLQARARLTSLPQAGRDASNQTLPALLRDDPTISQPFEFSRSRGGEPGLSVLELVDVVDHTKVTPTEPLIVHIDQKLEEGDLLLPLGFDGEFYLPLGKVNRSATGVEVTLDQLPAPTSQGSRDLKGSIKILFQKLVGQHFDRPYHYPLLRMAEVGDDGKVTYSAEGDIEAVAAKVAGAKTILLYVHGITGDTRLMTSSAQTSWLKLANPVTGLKSRYDLILSFDYENLHTKIEENAQLLKARLAAVGLGANHGKTLHIVSHSMGGLVSRWMLEREGGGAEKLVQHLVMLGTPNGGSPWPKVEDWALTALTLGINGLLPGWTGMAVGGLVSLIEGVDISLEQMNPTSDFLKELAKSPDPGIPYTIIAGNTQLIPLQPKADDKSEGLVARLWEKIKPKQWFYSSLDLAFFKEPNDIAVSVASIQSVPSNRNPQPRLVTPVPCDHSSYFKTEVGLVALDKSLN